MKRIVLLTILIALTTTIVAQKQVERIDRGAIAVPENDGYRISWRLLGNEPYSTGFNIYRNNIKINEGPITGATSFFDANGTTNSRYIVKAVIDGTEQEYTKSARHISDKEGDNAAYFDISINQPPQGQHGGYYTPNDASTGDLNGDGEYDIVLKWNPGNAKDNSQSGTTDNVFLDGYTLDGEHLWRIDLGPNIRAGAHYTQFLVYDFDGNGKAEIMCKTAPGTKDGRGLYITDGPAASADHSKEYRNSSGYILSGPEYLTVFDGETGAEMATADYWPQRGKVSAWGDNYGNRLDRYNATVAYVDGKRPSAIFQRGYYERLTMAAWNWRNGKLTREWTFDSNTPGNGSYHGQGNHSIHVIDANGDGLHDLVTGSAVISGTGEGLHTTGMGHGDATHVTYMIKDEDRPLIYMPHENKRDGVTLRYADTGEIIFQHKKGDDVGRACAAELDPEVPGFHFWASSGLGLYDINGEYAGQIPNSINFVIWWNGDLTRELMNGNTIDDWSIKNNRSTRLLTGNGTSSNNGSKSTPTLQADLFGDWREELILRKDNSQALRVYTTTMPTNHRLYTLMHDPVYRVAVSWQNSSYNQPPHPGFYLASDMDIPTQKPNVKLLQGYYGGSGEIIKNLKVFDMVNAAYWNVKPQLSADSSVYSNRTIKASHFPSYLEGKEWITTPTLSNEWFGDETLALFEVASKAVVSVFYAADAPAPAWLEPFDKNDETITVSSFTTPPHDLDLYEKEFAAGDTVFLGANTPDGNTEYTMYFVVARAANGTSKSRFETSINNSLKVYPNPVNSNATISYRIDSKQKISVKLYDFTGKLANIITNETQLPGLNHATFDASGYPSGIYLLVLSGENTVTKRKLIIQNDNN